MFTEYAALRDISKWSFVAIEPSTRKHAKISAYINWEKVIKEEKKKRDLKEFLILDGFFMGINTIFLLAADNCVKQDNNKKTLIMWLKLEPY